MGCIVLCTKSQNHCTWAGGVAFYQRRRWVRQACCITGQAGNFGAGKEEQMQDKVRGGEQVGDSCEDCLSIPGKATSQHTVGVRACSEESTMFLGYVALVGGIRFL